jgi:ABC-2 type transport system permease protein
MTMATVRAGVARGGIELRQTLTTVSDLWTYLFPAILLLGAIFFMRDAHVPGTSFSLGAQTLPGSFGMSLAFSGLLTVAQLLIVDREDGTLLRAKATPNGMLGYLIGKVVLVGGMLLISFLLQLIPGLLIVRGLHVGLTGWLTLIWLVPLGFIATMPIGAVLGSLFESPRNMALIMLPIIGLVAISGVFYPITALPGWLQAVGQCFPIYWLGLGMRSVFLPASLAAVELGHSWRHWEILGVLVLWSALGLTLAPAFLRRMARRESGSAVAARRERALVNMGR